MKTIFQTTLFFQRPIYGLQHHSNIYTHTSGTKQLQLEYALSQIRIQTNDVSTIYFIHLTKWLFMHSNIVPTIITTILGKTFGININSNWTTMNVRLSWDVFCRRMHTILKWFEIFGVLSGAPKITNTKLFRYIHLSSATFSH